MDLGISSYSIRNEWDDLAKNRIESLVAICQDMKIDRVELLDSEFTPETLAGIVTSMAGQGIDVFAIAHGVSLLVKPGEVEKAIQDGKAMLSLAHSAGVKYLRFPMGDGPMPRAYPPMDDFDDEEWAEYRNQMEDAVNFTEPVLTPLLAYAQELNVNIGVESHHSYSSNYIFIEKLLERFPSKHLGWILDVGNFENDALRWKALDVMKHRVFYVHAKAYDFDANGFETKLDYPRVVQILGDAGFDGTWSIEFEGKMNGIYGVHKTAELLRYSIARASGGEYTMNLDIPLGEELLGKYKRILKA